MQINKLKNLIIAGITIFVMQDSREINISVPNYGWFYDQKVELIYFKSKVSINKNTMTILTKTPLSRGDVACVDMVYDYDNPVAPKYYNVLYPGKC